MWYNAISCLIILITSHRYTMYLVSRNNIQDAVSRWMNDNFTSPSDSFVYVSCHEQQRSFTQAWLQLMSRTMDEKKSAKINADPSRMSCMCWTVHAQLTVPLRLRHQSQRLIDSQWRWIKTRNPWFFRLVVVLALIFRLDFSAASVDVSIESEREKSGSSTWVSVWWYVQRCFRSN